jgi:5-oxoprolinase (ATP-hydrolysing)
LSTGGWEFWIDRGGTFTDIVARAQDGTLTTHKYLSHNPEQYEDAALHGIRDALGLGADDPIPRDKVRAIKMGTTVATNALLERAGEPVAFVTTAGLGDCAEIGTQARPDTFALNIIKPALLYTRVCEVPERLRSDGSVDTALDRKATRVLLQSAFDDGLRAIAIALMHAYAHPDHEREVAKIARDIGFTQISASHEVSPLTKLVPRAQTTIVDAYLTPILRRYVDRIAAAFDGEPNAGQLLFMQSSGGLVDARSFRGRDAILSGPAGGIIGCVHTAKEAGFERVIGFDMGGTSTDVSHYAGALERVYETQVAGVSMRVPMLHIHTVAAGGGSLLRYEDGRFRVGPGSAGADPGPACYRRGGPLAVTDINVCLGKLTPDFFPQIFGPTQDQPLDAEAALEGFASIADSLGDGRSAQDVAEGFLAVAVEHMAQAIKKISVERGYDVSEYVLNCFGGAGGQHACLVAERLGIKRILLHSFAGVLSAYGMGLAPMRVERQRVIGEPLDERAVDLANALRAELREQCTAELAGQGLQDQGLAAGELTASASALLRYKGTDTTITVALGDADTMLTKFEAAHQRQYGFTAAEKTVLLDTLIVEASGLASPEGDAVRTHTSNLAETASPEPTSQTRIYSGGKWHDAPIYALSALSSGQAIAGPAVITEPTGTIVIERGWKGELGAGSQLILTEQSQRISALDTSEEADPVQLEIFNNLFMSIAEQMGIVLRNTSQSVNVKERLDFSCALFDADGNLVANAPHVPVHLGSMDASVKTIIASGQPIEPGDAFVQNNPHKGGSHLPDITVVSPVFDDGGERILFFTASRAHHEDVGGLSPGSMSPKGRTIHEEGVLLDNIKLVERGTFMTNRIEDVLRSGAYPARNIAQNVADLMAQVAANATGASELSKLVARYTLPVVHAYMGHIQRNAEACVRRAIRSLDNGAAQIELDSGAVISVAVEIDQQAGEAVIDFTGTSAQLDNAFNAPRAVTKAAVLYVMRCLVADAIPLNAGCMTPITLILPEGCLLNPAFPAAVVAGNVETSQAVTDCLFAALGKLGSSQGTMNNLTFGNARHQYYETICSGAPAGPGFDGAHGVHTHMTNTRMTDPEILEARYPVLLEIFRIDRGSGGKGEWNAGDGVTRAIRFLEPMHCAILSDHRRVAPLGSVGGEAGRIGLNRAIHADGREEDLGGCGETELDTGARIVIQTPTGGGFGPVSKRKDHEGPGA